MKKLFIVALVFLLGGCMGTSHLQTSLTEQKSALLYVFDSGKIDPKTGDSLSIVRYVVDDILAPDTVVKNKSTFVLPLVFFNMWKQEDQAQLGYSQLENDYKQFMKESFLQELKRSGKFVYQDNQGNIALDISVKKIEMSAPILQRGNFLFLVFFFGYSSQTYAGPVDVAIDADVRVNRGGQVVMTREVHGKFRTSILSGSNVKMKDYSTAMTEGLSMAIKDLNEKIVKEINQI
ncbi:MAG TPA: hypothetical protein VL197_01155 [Nitrospirota bacterium]|nr:hypothetical protein [Nitrospirota bacterium]